MDIIIPLLPFAQALVVNDKNHDIYLLSDDIMIIAQISIAPVGKEIDLSSYVKKAVTILQKETERCEINAMATVVETKTIDQLFQAVHHAHNEVLSMPGIHRVITEIKIDDRRDKNATMDDKIKAATI